MGRKFFGLRSTAEVFWFGLSGSREGRENDVGTSFAVVLSLELMTGN